MVPRSPEFRIKRVDGRFVLWTLSHPMNETDLARAIDRYLDEHGRVRA